MSSRKGYVKPIDRLSPEEKKKRKEALKKGTLIAKERTERQKRFLDAYENLGNRNLSKACKVSGISNGTVYKWIRLFPKFAKRMMLIDEAILDQVEAAMIDRATGKETRGDKDAQFFIMRTRGRSRGYGEHQTIEADVTQRISQERIDAIVRAHEKVTIGITKLPDGVIRHLNQVISKETKQIPEVIEID